jgi:hypothetical protein
MKTTRATHTATLNCGHKVTWTAHEGQLSIPTWLDPEHPWTCVDCWNFHGYEGFRYLVEVTDNEPEPEPTEGADSGPETIKDTAEQRQAKPARTATCRRCRATLRSARSVARRIGPVCEREERREAAARAAGFKPAAVAKAQELIEQGAIVPLRGRRVFQVVSSDGTATYKTAPQSCNCAAGVKGRYVCYHRVAATLLAA